MQEYEAIFIIKNNENNERNIGVIKEKIEEQIISEGARITQRIDSGVRKLAYQIKKQTKGYFYCLSFKINYKEKEAEEHIATKLNTIEEVIKHIIVKMEER